MKSKCFRILFFILLIFATNHSFTGFADYGAILDDTPTIFCRKLPLTILKKSTNRRSYSPDVTGDIPILLAIRGFWGY